MEVIKKQEAVNSQRKDQIASGDRSDKIRTYNFPQSRITGILLVTSFYLEIDHRTNLTLYGIEKMLNGELLDQFIEEYLDKIYNSKINELLETEKSS
jgi:Protein chain release factor A